MREIKFRGLRSDGKGWVYGFYSPVNVPILGTLGHCINEGGYRAIDIDEKTLGQFTGLKDKNGNDIYEGDILKIESEKSMIVGWSEKFASFILNREDWAFSHWFGESCEANNCEVIGNIHENPELLS